MKRVFIRPDRCTSCKTCVLSCAVAHSQSRALFTAITEVPRPYPRLFVEPANGRKVPILCRHCEDAPCLRACIAGALYRDPTTEAVLADWDRCIGCWTCIMVCPYGVVQRQAEVAKAVKCDLCPDRETPACVESCPTEALVFTDVDSFAQDNRRAAAAAT